MAWGDRKRHSPGTPGPRDRAVTPNDDARAIRGIPAEVTFFAFLIGERERLGLASHTGHVVTNNNS